MAGYREGLVCTLTLADVLIISCIMPIVIVHSDCLEATNAQLMILLVLVLVIMSVTMVGVLISFPLAYYGFRGYNYFIAGIICTCILVLAAIIPVGCIYGPTFTGIPTSCATLGECYSYCISRGEDYRPKLVDAQKIKLMIFNKGEHSCGKCTCTCASYPDDYSEHICKPIEETHFGWSTSTKIALGVLSGLVVVLICIGVILLCFDENVIFAGGYIIITTVCFLIACSFPILFIYGSETETVQRDNLLIATSVPMLMTILGVIACYGTYASDCTGRRVIISAIVYTVLAVSIPVAIEFGIRFASTPHACALNGVCPENVGIQNGTIIALEVFGGLLILLLLVLAGWGFWNFLKAIYRECRWWPFC